MHLEAIQNVSRDQLRKVAVDGKKEGGGKSENPLTAILSGALTKRRTDLKEDGSDTDEDDDWDDEDLTPKTI